MLTWQGRAAAQKTSVALKHGSMGSVHVWEGSAARAARSERGRGLPNREGATSGGNSMAAIM